MHVYIYLYAFASALWLVTLKGIVAYKYTIYLCTLVAVVVAVSYNFYTVSFAACS